RRRSVWRNRSGGCARPASSAGSSGSTAATRWRRERCGRWPAASPADDRGGGRDRRRARRCMGTPPPRAARSPSMTRVHYPSIIPLALVFALVACSNKQRLGEYDFRGRTLAVVTIAPAHPEVFSGASFARVDADDPVELVLRAGSEAVREVS